MEETVGDGEGFLNSDQTRESPQSAQRRYREFCRHCGVVPLKKVVDQIGTEFMNLRYVNIGANGVRALIGALKKNTSVISIDLSNNGLGDIGGRSAIGLLTANNVIRRLNLSSNQIGEKTSQGISEALRKNCTLKELDLSENELNDIGIENICRGIEENVTLTKVSLRRNCIGITGTCVLAKTIAANLSIECLDLSWNHIRGKGAVAIVKALMFNSTLVSLDLSWNGLGLEGSIALEEALAYNNTLQSLNLKSNRLNWESASHIAGGLLRNSCLQILSIGLNPLTMTGITEILRAVDSNNSGICFIDLEGLVINAKVAYMIERIGRRRKFKCLHQLVIDSEDILGVKIDIKDDPMKFLSDYLNDKAIRVVDLFRSIDKHGNGSVTRSRFIRNMKRLKVPLTGDDLQIVTERIDSESTGRINYSMMYNALRNFRIRLRESDRKRQQQARRERMQQQRILNEPFKGLPLESRKLPNLSDYGSYFDDEEHLSLSVYTSGELSTPSSTSRGANPIGGRMSKDLRSSCQVLPPIEANLNES